MEEGTLVPEPEKILERRLKKKGNHAGVECLVQWEGTNEEDAMWIDVEELRKKWPELEDEFY